MLLDYAIEHTKKAALELIKYQDDDIKEQIKNILSDESASEMNICEVMRTSSGGILRLAMIFAVFYAIALPIIIGAVKLSPNMMMPIATPVIGSRVLRMDVRSPPIRKVLC